MSLRRQGSSDAELLQFYPQLNAANLVNVWTYAEANSEEIETALREEAGASQADTRRVASLLQGTQPQPALAG